MMNYLDNEIKIIEQKKLEKVIEGLEACSMADTKDDCIGYGCPYLIYNDEVSDDCQEQMFDDTLALLKAQEPRVMTLDEVLENAGEIGFPCWVEDHIEDIGGAFLFPAVVTSDDTYVEYTGDAYYEGAIYHLAYNKRLRCWTSRPTEEQRKAVKWDG